MAAIDDDCYRPHVLRPPLRDTRLAAAALALLCAASSCTDGKSPASADPRQAEKPTTREPTRTKPPGKRTLPADAPSPTACTTHDQCMVVMAAPAEDPCCDVTVTVGPRRRDYIQYVETYRETHCENVECPPLSLPGARPAPCADVPRCVAGECNIACNDPTYDTAAAPARADPCVTTCIERRQMQAISAQAIEENCRADCSADKFTP